MSDDDRFVARCLRGHETVITATTLRPMLDVNKKGTTFVIRCPHVEDGVICGAPAQIAQRDVSRLLGISASEAKQMMKDMHAQKTGAGVVAPLQPPEPEEPQDDAEASQAWQEALKPQVATIPSPRMPNVSRIPVTPRPTTRPELADDDMADPSTAIRAERPKLERKYPPIRVVEKKDPLAVLKEVINEAGLKDDVTYTLHRIADLMDDGWSTEDFVMTSKQYGVNDAVARGVAMRFKLEWKSHLKQLEEQQRMLERASGPAMGPFSRDRTPGESEPLVPLQAPQYQQMAQQIGMQMLQSNPIMQMWAQSNPRDFEEMVKKVVEQTLKAQQPQQQLGMNLMMGGMNPMMNGMNPMMNGMNPMMGMMGGMNPMMGMMGGMNPYQQMPYATSRRETMTEEKVADIVEQKMASAMNEIKVVLAQIGGAQRPQQQDDPLLKQIVLNMLQQQNQKKEADPMVTMLLQHVLENAGGRGDAIEAMLAQLLQETKKGQDSRSLDLDHLREMINLKSIEGELGLKQREFDDRRESRDLMRQALNEGLTVVGQAFASTMMSRGMGGAPMSMQQQQPVKTEMLQTDDGNIVMRCRACNELIMAPPDAIEVICPFCNAQFPVVDAPDFGDDEGHAPEHVAEEAPVTEPAPRDETVPSESSAQQSARGRGRKTIKHEDAEQNE